MKTTKVQVTKEWFSCKPFEKILQTLWNEQPDIRFTRQEILDRVNRGDFGDNLIATYSPEEGSVEEILSGYRSKGKEWLDIQNLTYHYSHQNPNGNYYSRVKMLSHIGGRGIESRYELYSETFIN